LEKIENYSIVNKIIGKDTFMHKNVHIAYTSKTNYVAFQYITIENYTNTYSGKISIWYIKDRKNLVNCYNMEDNESNILQKSPIYFCCNKDCHNILITLKFQQSPIDSNQLVDNTIVVYKNL